LSPIHPSSHPEKTPSILHTAAALSFLIDSFSQTLSSSSHEGEGRGRLSGPVKAPAAVASWFAISSAQCANICTGLKWSHSTNSTYQPPSNSSQICIIVFIDGAVLVPSFRSPRHGHFRFINRARSHK
jgi:hypothetical protein